MNLFKQARKEPLWQDEFSIHASDERYVSRRQFTKFLVLTSFGMFVGNLWILARSLLNRPATFPEMHICDASAVPVGEVWLFRYPTEKDPCILVRPDDQTYVAFSQKCTHLSCAVFYAREKNRLECPCHEGYFSVRNGDVLQGPPPRPLPRILLERRGDSLFAVGVAIGKET